MTQGRREKSAGEKETVRGEGGRDERERRGTTANEERSRAEEHERSA